MRRFFQQRCPIVSYHAVWREGDPRLALFGGVSLDALAQDLRLLARMFDFASLAEMLAAGADSAARPRVAVTFDDGFDLIAGGAADVLEKHGVRATVFVNSDAYRHERVLWQHAFGVVNALRGEAVFLRAFNAAQARRRLGPDIAAFGDYIGATKSWPQGHIDPVTDEVWTHCGMPPMRAFLSEHRPYLDLAALSAWRARGHEVGFHGKSHRWSRALSAEEVDRQIVAPARALKEDLGIDKIAFAYPFGDRLAPADERALAASGAFTCLLGMDRLARRGEPLHSIDRVEADLGLVRHVYGRPLIRALRRQDLPQQTGAAQKDRADAPFTDRSPISLQPARD
ncbi:MAG: polysaccharide deacetylase family protein [Parvularculaceae bacterium]